MRPCHSLHEQPSSTSKCSLGPRGTHTHARNNQFRIVSWNYNGLPRVLNHNSLPSWALAIDFLYGLNTSSLFFLMEPNLQWDRTLLHHEGRTLGWRIFTHGKLVTSLSDLPFPRTWRHMPCSQWQTSFKSQTATMTPQDKDDDHTSQSVVKTHHTDILFTLSSTSSVKRYNNPKLAPSHPTPNNA